MLGKKVAHFNVTTSENQFDLPLQRGIYIAVFKSKEGASFSQKFLAQ